MACTIARDVCEGIDDCLTVCPTECIRPGEGPPNAKGTRGARIDGARCIDCGACLQAARHAATFQLRLLVARGELRYKWLS
jgi:ferredoxin